METSMYLNSVDGFFRAKGIYTPEQTIALKGSMVNIRFSETFGGAEIVHKLRNDISAVDKNGTLLKNCTFSSYSTAAQFVTGRSSNGYSAWRVDTKHNLGRFLGRKRKNGDNY